MKDIPTYYDLKYASTSKIFESEQIKGLSPDQIQEGEKFYNLLLEKLKNKEEIDEGFLSGALTGAASALVGPSIMKVICKVVGITEGGPLYKLLTSPLIMGSIGYSIGK